MVIIRSDGKQLTCISEEHGKKKIEADIYLQNTISRSQKRWTKKDYEIKF